MVGNARGTSPPERIAHFGDLGNAEVEELERARLSGVLAQHQVFGLHVPMDDAGNVHGSKRGEELPDVADRLQNR